MRFVTAVLAIFVLNYLLGLFLPWWIIAVVGFLCGYLIQQTAARSFLSGFIGGFVLWAVIAVIIDLSNDQVLSRRIAGLFTLPQPWLMSVVTGFVGGLVTGMGAITGSLLRNLTNQRKAA